MPYKDPETRRRYNREWQRRHRPYRALPFEQCPPGEYGVIVADPPWRYSPYLKKKRIERRYPTMTLRNIKRVRPPAAKDCVLFLWATATKLDDALAVVRRWGFAYKTSLVWVKEGPIGLGYYARNLHEIVLVARRGDPGVPPPRARFPSVFYARRGEQLGALIRLVERMYPDKTKAYLFATRPYPGWFVWGAPDGRRVVSWPTEEMRR